MPQIYCEILKSLFLSFTPSSNAMPSCGCLLSKRVDWASVVSWLSQSPITTTMQYQNLNLGIQYQFIIHKLEKKQWHYCRKEGEPNQSWAFQQNEEPSALHYPMGWVTRCSIKLPWTCIKTKATKNSQKAEQPRKPMALLENPNYNLDCMPRGTLGSQGRVKSDARLIS